VIIIMTTNAGAEEMAKSSIGFTLNDHSVDSMDAIKRLFSPEFRNRLDSIVQFKSLASEVILSVVDKFIVELQAQLDAKGVSLEVASEARAWLAEKGYDRTMGARPMARIIRDLLRKPLADELLFGKLSRGGEVHVHLEDDTLAFEIIEKAAPALEQAKAT
jgi:ATP-dependent Clp protease ATP-binding subunit ClpA